MSKLKICKSFHSSKCSLQSSATKSLFDSSFLENEKHLTSISSLESNTRNSFKKRKLDKKPIKYGKKIEARKGKNTNNNVKFSSKIEIVDEVLSMKSYTVSSKMVSLDRSTNKNSNNFGENKSVTVDDETVSKYGTSKIIELNENNDDTDFEDEFIEDDKRNIVFKNFDCGNLSCYEKSYEEQLKVGFTIDNQYANGLKNKKLFSQISVD